MIKKFELGDIRRIINMIPQKRSEGIKYIRTEKSGYYSLLSDNGELNYTMLNETSKYILDSCDGTIAILLISANSRCVEPPFAIVRTYCF